MSDVEDDAERARALTLLRVQGGQAAKRDELAEARAAAAAHHQKALEAARALEEAQARVETAEREARAQVAQQAAARAAVGIALLEGQLLKLAKQRGQWRRCHTIFDRAYGKLDVYRDRTKAQIMASVERIDSVDAVGADRFDVWPKPGSTTLGLPPPSYSGRADGGNGGGSLSLRARSTHERDKWVDSIRATLNAIPATPRPGDSGGRKALDAPNEGTSSRGRTVDSSNSPPRSSRRTRQAASARPKRSERTQDEDMDADVNGPAAHKATIAIARPRLPKQRQPSRVWLQGVGVMRRHIGSPDHHGPYPRRRYVHPTPNLGLTTAIVSAAPPCRIPEPPSVMGWVADEMRALDAEASAAQQRADEELVARREQEQARLELSAIYEATAPAKLANIEGLLERHADDLRTLVQKVMEKNGVTWATTEHSMMEAGSDGGGREDDSDDEEHQRLYVRVGTPPPPPLPPDADFFLTLRNMPATHCTKGAALCAGCRHAAADRRMRLLKVYKKPTGESRPTLDVRRTSGSAPQRLEYEAVLAFESKHAAESFIKERGLVVEGD